MRIFCDFGRCFFCFVRCLFILEKRPLFGLLGYNSLKRGRIALGGLSLFVEEGAEQLHETAADKGADFAAG